MYFHRFLSCSGAGSLGWPILGVVKPVVTPIVINRALPLR